MSDIVDRLRIVAEEYFDCTHGEPKAFFMLPQRGGEDIMVIYVTYVIAGDSLADLEQWMINEVLHPLSLKAGDEGRLYWRLPTCFDIALIDGEYHLRTRLAVLDGDLNPVRLDDVLKEEGQPVRRLDISTASIKELKEYVS